MIEQPIPSVRLAAHQFSSSIVKIQYDDARLDTTLQLHGGQVVGLQSLLDSAVLTPDPLGGLV